MAAAEYAINLCGAWDLSPSWRRILLRDLESLLLPPPGENRALLALASFFLFFCIFAMSQIIKQVLIFYKGNPIVFKWRFNVKSNCHTANSWLCPPFVATTAIRQFLPEWMCCCQWAAIEKREIPDTLVTEWNKVLNSILVFPPVKL